MSTSQNPAEARVTQHYATENLTERILSAFETSGKPRAAIRVEDLAAVDEFHIGGLEATEAVAVQMNLRTGMHLLDIGCGIGGPARYFAVRHACEVVGIDLTEDFIRTACDLSELVGLRTSVRFEQRNATSLPFERQSFDSAYMFHVGMNIREKAMLFEEAQRVLRPGGVFAIYDVMRIGPGQLQFPVPWASNENESFLGTIDEYRQGLTEQGFAILAERRRREFAIDFFERMRQRNQQEVPGPLGIHLIMGESAMAKTGNDLDALRRGVIAPVEILART
jgi:SAM-dependent methyltransferase